MIAFWRYDRFPGVLSSTVVDIVAGGRVTAVGYSGMQFNPIIILNDEEGIIVQNKLKQLEREFNNEMAQLKQKYQDRAVEIAPFLKKK